MTTFHVDLGGRVLDVVQVEHRLALDDAHADRGDAVADRGRCLRPGMREIASATAMKPP